MKQNVLKLLLLASSLLFLTACGSTSKQLIGTTWVGDYKRYEAKQEKVPDLLEHGLIRLSFSKDSLTQCNIRKSTSKPPKACQYFYLKYKQNSIYFVDTKESFVLKKRTEDCLELEHVDRNIRYYLKPYQE